MPQPKKKRSPKSKRTDINWRNEDVTRKAIDELAGILMFVIDTISSRPSLQRIDATDLLGKLGELRGRL